MHLLASSLYMHITCPYMHSTCTRKNVICTQVAHYAIHAHPTNRIKAILHELENRMHPIGNYPMLEPCVSTTEGMPSSCMSPSVGTIPASSESTIRNARRPSGESLCTRVASRAIPEPRSVGRSPMIRSARSSAFDSKPSAYSIATPTASPFRSNRSTATPKARRCASAASASRFRARASRTAAPNSGTLAA